MGELQSSDEFVKDGSVDLHGHSLIRSYTGTWKASLFVIGVEIAERFAYAGISVNLVIYLTSVLNESTATAASNVNMWSGVAFVLPFLGAFIADSYLAFFKRNAPIPFREQSHLASSQEVEVLRTESRRQLLQTNKFRFLDKATIEDELDFECRTTRNWRLCTVQQVEEVKLLLGMLPIWMTCLMYGVVLAQSFTFFTEQGSTMDRKIGRHFVIPSASLQCFNSITVMLFVPVYDCLFVPIAKRLSGNERGITLLQRIGAGMFFSALSMIVAALIEIKRLKAAKDNGLIDMPYATIPISVFWLLPQYVLFGIADVFIVIGLQEYFYDQMPDTMKSLGIAVYLSVIGVGSFLSSILILVIEKVTCRKQEECWFADNLNKAHLDYFYWLLASLSLLNLGIFITLASCYKYKKVAPSGTENSA
ncbi:protein NRT1/ PTR FAMILY 5.10 isoform X2 [Cryptomeria japonica]|uniref:protein NRT1/ PTR FAMILY 5.10 isoform X2 n=1 Tax=Cryptomeria japonica TaxID=3369 RepID=UPI0027DA5941|nr:protein NRT1/ PTR FAMILY 5.10 isoform X2 [Cryptomeria japonica]